MFSLLISSNGDAWEDPENMAMDVSRFNNEYSGSEGAGISADDPVSLRRLEEVPAVLMYEYGTDAPNAKVVRIGHVRDVRRNGRQLVFRFEEQSRIALQIVYEFGAWISLGEYEKSRTHWAVKDGNIGKQILERAETTGLRYDVALSFAGEQRAYVERVAEHLKANGVKVFYDKDEEAALWGKNLIETFADLYSRNALYCIMFISGDYARKMWTNHERRSALERAISERHEYLLPVRFDHTEVPGLNSSVHYLPAAEKTPEEIAAIFLRKLRG